MRLRRSQTTGNRPPAERTALDSLLWLLLVAPFIGGPLVTGGSNRWFDVVAAISAFAVVAARRQWPLPALATALAGALITSATLQRPTALLPASLVLTFHAATIKREWAIRAGVAATSVLAVSTGIMVMTGFAGPELLAGLAWPPLVTAAGNALRARRETILDTEERLRQADATRDIESRRRVAEERVRIARELHDVVAHQIAVVNVQAGVASHLIRSDPDAAARAINLVRSSAQQTLDEMASILGLLRTDDPGPASSPSPRIDDLSTLIESFGGVGLVVGYRTSGNRCPVSDGVALAVFRTLQEALTNAHKHGVGPATVELTWAERHLSLVVSNQVGAGAAGTDGFGLIGMRERISAVGGRVSAAEGPDGAFVVSASFPVLREEGSS